ncbi:hypothetical protein ACFQ0D_29690 [Micromonospora zhanjiangensis]
MTSPATHTEYGDRRAALAGELRTPVGSQVHGLALTGAGDRAEVARLPAAGRTPLPPEPDLAAVSAWSVQAHRRHWGWTTAREA